MLVRADQSCGPFDEGRSEAMRPAAGSPEHDAKQAPGAVDFDRVAHLEQVPDQAADPGSAHHGHRGYRALPSSSPHRDVGRQRPQLHQRLRHREPLLGPLREPHRFRADAETEK